MSLKTFLENDKEVQEFFGEIIFPFAWLIILIGSILLAFVGI